MIALQQLVLPAASVCHYHDKCKTAKKKKVFGIYCIGGQLSSRIMSAHDTQQVALAVNFIGSFPEKRIASGNNSQRE